MKIAQIANLAERVPPKKYGGTERVVSALTEELVHRGHEVTLFASGDSLTSAKLNSVYPQSLREARIPHPYGASPLALLNIATAYQMQDEFDIIHDHNWFISLPTAQLARVPVVMTVHGAFDLHNRKLFEMARKPHFVTISKSQGIPLPTLHHAGVVYNGLSMDTYPFSQKDDGYLLYVGRIARDKGTHDAIDIAHYLHLPLILAAKLDPEDESYFKEFVEPKLSEQIRWIGEVDEEDRNTLMSKALCLLHPTMWREPFGLTLIEAMACGAPVVAYRRGSIPELIINGKTGFIVEDINEMATVIKEIKKIDRETCRKHALENFSAKKMADEYETIYERILAESVAKRTNGKKYGTNGFAQTMLQKPHN